MGLVTPSPLPALLHLNTASVSSDSQPSHLVKSPKPLDFPISDLSPVSKVSFVGAGYVGGPTSAVLAFANPDTRVHVVDTEEIKTDKWKSKHLPIDESELKEVVRNARDGTNTVLMPQGACLESRVPNLSSSIQCARHIIEADTIFVSVHTPTKTSGVGAGAATDMASFEAAVRSIALAATPGAIIVEKSTVPCGTVEMIRELLETNRRGVQFEIPYDPEFLAEGTAIKELLRPARFLIGSSSTPSGRIGAARLDRVYTAWVNRSTILHVQLWSSELAKLVADTMLAQRISIINTISATCEKTGANVTDIADAVGMDDRIGFKFLNAGVGFGGSCFKIFSACAVSLSL